MKPSVKSRDIRRRLRKTLRKRGIKRPIAVIRARLREHGNICIVWIYSLKGLEDLLEAQW